MKKIMIAALGLSLLSGTAVFAQNTPSSTDGGTMKGKKSTHHKKDKKSTSTSDTAASK